MNIPIIDIAAAIADEQEPMLQVSIPVRNHTEPPDALVDRWLTVRKFRTMGRQVRRLEVGRTQ